MPSLKMMSLCLIVVFALFAETYARVYLLDDGNVDPQAQIPSSDNHRSQDVEYDDIIYSANSEKLQEQQQQQQHQQQDPGGESPPTTAKFIIQQFESNSPPRIPEILDFTIADVQDSGKNSDTPKAKNNYEYGPPDMYLSAYKNNNNEAMQHQMTPQESRIFSQAINSLNASLQDQPNQELPQYSQNSRQLDGIFPNSNNPIALPMTNGMGTIESFYRAQNSYDLGGGSPSTNLIKTISSVEQPINVQTIYVKQEPSPPGFSPPKESFEYKNQQPIINQRIIQQTTSNFQPLVPEPILQSNLPPNLNQQLLQTSSTSNIASTSNISPIFQQLSPNMPSPFVQHEQISPNKIMQQQNQNSLSGQIMLPQNSQILIQQNPSLNQLLQNQVSQHIINPLNNIQLPLNDKRFSQSSNVRYNVESSLKEHNNPQALIGLLNNNQENSNPIHYGASMPPTRTPQFSIPEFDLKEVFQKQYSQYVADSNAATIKTLPTTKSHLMSLENFSALHGSKIPTKYSINFLNKNKIKVPFMINQGDSVKSPTADSIFTRPKVEIPLLAKPSPGKKIKIKPPYKFYNPHEDKQIEIIKKRPFSVEVRPFGGKRPAESKPAAIIVKIRPKIPENENKGPPMEIRVKTRPLNIRPDIHDNSQYHPLKAQHVLRIPLESDLQKPGGIHYDPDSSIKSIDTSLIDVNQGGLSHNYETLDPEMKKYLDETFGTKSKITAFLNQHMPTSLTSRSSPGHKIIIRRHHYS